MRNTQVLQRCIDILKELFSWELLEFQLFWYEQGFAWVFLLKRRMSASFRKRYLELFFKLCGSLEIFHHRPSDQVVDLLNGLMGERGLWLSGAEKSTAWRYLRTGRAMRGGFAEVGANLYQLLSRDGKGIAASLLLISRLPISISERERLFECMRLSNTQKTAFSERLCLLGELYVQREKRRARREEKRRQRVETVQPESGMSSAETNPRVAALELLGLPSAATVAEIKRAYRRLVKEVHPDILKSRGVSAAELSKAEERFRNLQTAYELLTATR